MFAKSLGGWTLCGTRYEHESCNSKSANDIHHFQLHAPLPIRTILGPDLPIFPSWPPLSTKSWSEPQSFLRSSTRRLIWRKWTSKSWRRKHPSAISSLPSWPTRWIAGKITQILGDDDDVIIELCFNLLEGSRYVRSFFSNSLSSRFSLTCLYSQI